MFSARRDDSSDERLEAAAGGRISALEAVEPERAKGRSAGCEGAASESQDRERSSEPEMEKVRDLKGVDRDLCLSGPRAGNGGAVSWFAV